MYASLPSLEEIWAWLDSVSDPEIPILSVVDLGIVRNVRWAAENEKTDFATGPQRSDLTLLVTVTPTYSGCPAMAVIKEDIQQALLQQGISRVCFETQLSPAWTTDWMTERGRKRLYEYGIAPPEPHHHKLGLARVLHSFSDGGSEVRPTEIPCPRCGSSDTRLVSRFGSTPCKAFYTCNSCLEPFDYFKCH
jgi:ring-1,2-phenylacetyl-CoA epoxidase subunit PaaD